MARFTHRYIHFIHVVIYCLIYRPINLRYVLIASNLYHFSFFSLSSFTVMMSSSIFSSYSITLFSTLSAAFLLSVLKKSMNEKANVAVTKLTYPSTSKYYDYSYYSTNSCNWNNISITYSGH